MNYLGSSRVITNSFTNHGTAEDYAGDHKSDVSIVGSGRVVKIINRFVSYEDSINYNDYLNNKNYWQDGAYYNCISITGKSVRMHYEELGGNQIWIETYFQSQKITLRFCHLDSVLVNVGDIIKSNQVFALQGNTGLILSSKDRSNITYGSHVHLEVTDINGTFLNPRNFASGEYITNYIEQSNSRDESKKQIQILVDKINIREKPSEISTDLGDVYYNEIYTILDEIDSDIYTWYKISTNNGLTGFVANKKEDNWMNTLMPNEKTQVEENNTSNQEKTQTEESNSNRETAQVEENNSSNQEAEVDHKEEYELIFECKKEDYYYLKLYENEKLYIKRP